MTKFETWLKSDLSRMIQVQPLDGVMFTADNAGNIIGVEVTDNGQPANISGGVTGWAIRADGGTVMINGTLSGNRASIVMPASAYVVPGPISIVIKVGTMTVGACTGYVYQSTTDEIIDPGRVIPSLAELLAHINDAIQAADNANSAATNANAKASAADAAATRANTAADNANTKASAADTAATNANNKAAAAQAAATKIDGMTVAATKLAEGSNPTVTISEVSGHKHIAFGIPKGDKGAKGDPGKDFHIAYTFISVAQMQAYTQAALYDYAMIDTGSVQDPETGRLYCWENDSTWHYIGDLSGAQGIKGETGTGIASIQLNQDYTLTITMDDGNSYTTASIRGEQGPKGNPGQNGNDGANAYVHIRYAAQQPTQDSDIKTTPDEWIGLYSGTSATAPTTYTSYTWYKFKGETGIAENIYGTTVPMSPTDSTKVASAVQAAMTAASEKYTKPASGIPATDIADGVIPGVMTGSTAQAAGTAGLVPAPSAGDQGKALFGDGTWKTVNTNVYGDEIPMSETDETTVSEAIDAVDAKIPFMPEPVSGDIATFTDVIGGMPLELTIGIEPVQDLHGYDSPWPAGGGKNLLPLNLDNIKTANTIGTWSGNAYEVRGITFTIITDSAGNITAVKANGTNNSGAEAEIHLDDNNGSVLDAGNYILSGCTSGSSDTYFVNYKKTASGSGTWGKVTTSDVTVENAAINFFMLTVKNGATVNNVMFYPMIRLSSVSDATFAPYSNICPISGWTGAEVTRTGKNLLKLFDTDSTHRGVPITKENGVVKRVGTWDSTNTASGFSISGKTISLSNYSNYNITTENNTIKLKPGTYTASAQATKTTGASNLQVFFGVFSSLGGTLANGAGVIENSYGSILGQSKTWTFTLTKEAYFYCGINSGVSSDGTAVDWAIEVQLEAGSSASAFIQYNGNITEYPFPSSAGTVYGGTLTVHQDGTGTLVVDRANVDLGTLTWNASAGAYYSTDIASIIKLPESTSVIGNYISSALVQIPSGITLTANKYAVAQNGRLWSKDGTSATASDFKTAMNGVQLVYELTTPITYELTALDVIATLKGSNNVWADTGSIISAQSGVDMTGATATRNGTHGFVPAPAAGDQTKVLTGDGTWKVSPGAKVYEKTVTITNTSGAYSQTFTDENISADMKAVELEVNRSFVFGDSIIVTPNDGSVTVACNDVAGTDTIKISLIKVIDDPTAVTSTEFTILNNRLLAVENVCTDTNIVIGTADWELNSGSYEYTWESSIINSACSVEVMLRDGSESSGLESFEFEKVAGGVKFTADILATGDLPLTVRVINAKADAFQTLTASDIYTEAVTGADNVEEALTAIAEDVSDNTQAIANLEDSFTPVKITPVAQENVSLIDHCVYTVGNMAFVNLSFSLSAAPTSTQQFVLNLPKPKANVPITAHKNLGGGNYQAFLSTAGAIRNDYDGFANGGKYFVSCAYAI